MVPLREDALAKIKAGITSPDEVLRVVQVDENEVPCPGCKALIEADFATCPYCRKSLKTNCAGCGQTLRLDWKLCPYCNTSALVQPLADEAETEAEPPRRSPRDAGRAPARRGAIRAADARPDEEDGPRPAFDLPEESPDAQFIGADLDAGVRQPAPAQPSSPAVRQLGAPLPHPLARRSRPRPRLLRRSRTAPAAPTPLRQCQPRRRSGPSIRPPAAVRCACWSWTTTRTSG